MTGTAAGLRLIEHGIAELPTPTVDLQPAPSDVWVDTGLRLTLPTAGTYQLDGTVRAALAVVSPGTSFIKARLWDETSGVMVPRSEAFVSQVSTSSSAGTIDIGDHSSAPIQVEHTVTGPATLRLDVARVVLTGATQVAVIWSDHNGRTTLRYARIA